MPSAIEWTDETWNPVTGCSRVSPGCDNCYMFALYPRLKAMGVNGYEDAPDQVRLLPERLDIPMSWKKPRHVFVNSMSDLFHPRVPFDFVFDIFSTMHKSALERGHVFQVLTKEAWARCRVVEGIRETIPGWLASQYMDGNFCGEPEICSANNGPRTPTRTCTLRIRRTAARTPRFEAVAEQRGNSMGDSWWRKWRRCKAHAD